MMIEQSDDCKHVFIKGSCAECDAAACDICGCEPVLDSCDECGVDYCEWCQNIHDDWPCCQEDNDNE